MQYNDSKMADAGVPVNPPPYTAAPPGPPPPHVVGVVQQPTTTIIHTNMGAAVVPVVVGTRMGPKPTIVVCKSCNQQLQTRVELKSSMRTHLFALLLCLFGCWPCACIPYCVDSCKNADHYCPNCNAYIGSYVN